MKNEGKFCKIFTWGGWHCYCCGGNSTQLYCCGSALRQGRWGPSKRSMIMALKTLAWAGIRIWDVPSSACPALTDWLTESLRRAVGTVKVAVTHAGIGIGSAAPPSPPARSEPYGRIGCCGPARSPAHRRQAAAGLSLLDRLASHCCCIACNGQRYHQPGCLLQGEFSIFFVWNIVE